jgi:hypothetical protein
LPGNNWASPAALHSNCAAVFPPGVQIKIPDCLEYPSWSQSRGYQELIQASTHRYSYTQRVTATDLDNKKLGTFFGGEIYDFKICEF